MSKQSKSFTGIAPIETARKGAYISRIRSGNVCAKKFEVDGFCRFNRKYQVTDLEDHCNDQYLKKGTKIFIHCNY